MLCINNEIKQKCRSAVQLYYDIMTLLSDNG